jgi:hypothetical protein
MPVIYLINMTNDCGERDRQQNYLSHLLNVRYTRGGVCRWLAASPYEFRPMAAHNATLTKFKSLTVHRIAGSFLTCDFRLFFTHVESF